MRRSTVSRAPRQSRSAQRASSTASLAQAAAGAKTDRLGRELLRSLNIAPAARLDEEAAQAEHPGLVLLHHLREGGLGSLAVAETWAACALSSSVRGSRPRRRSASLA